MYVCYSEKVILMTGRNRLGEMRKEMKSAKRKEEKSGEMKLLRMEMRHGSRCTSV